MRCSRTSINSSTPNNVKPTSIRCGGKIDPSSVVSPVPEPGHRSVGAVPLPPRVQTLLVQRLSTHLQRPDQYATPSEQAVAGILDSGDVSALSLVFVAAYYPRARRP